MTAPAPPSGTSSSAEAPRRRMQINPPVFYLSAALVLAFAVYGAVFTDQAGRVFNAIQARIVEDFSWLYVASTAGFLFFVLFLMASRYGDIKLGPDDSEPEYSYPSWFAMLFSAGMGIGIIFFGVAEPIQHYVSPPTGEGGTLAAARRAMTLTFFHWGLHAWAIYIVVGLALAYFSFRRGLPLTIRSALYPLIGRRIHGPIGHAVDIFAVLGTMFGIATSLGLGVLQVNAGFSHLFGVPSTLWVQIALIAVITAMATGSVVSGLDKGIRRLSELNIGIAVVLLVFVLVTGSTVFLLKAFVQNIGAYLGDVIPRTFSLYAYEPNPWFGEWTLFYWGWWIAWSPFVGMFIARISRGRTIRQFVTGVLLVPVLFTFLWMTVFGNTALLMEMDGAAPIARVVDENISLALFALLEHLPWPTITAGLATLLVILFFVTSADSGALVIDMITSGAETPSPVWQRIFWAVSAGVVSAVLLATGGLQALQTAAIASALPFVVIMVLMCYGVLRALQTESATPGGLPIVATEDDDASMTWEQRLDSIIRYHRRGEIETYLQDVATPALEAVAAQVREGGLEATVQQDDGRVALAVQHGDRGAFVFTVTARGFRMPSFAWADTARDTGARLHYRAMARTTDADAPHDVTGFTQEQLIHDFLVRYGRFRNTRRLG
ncbi:choline/glycine/proline betaine transport protein [Paracidovorax wautersii]|uniref:Choline/glycine/proline betaine transport protein n=2 Tax=Paracidovorax wautersii TaxID=1177982 RepID=A0ABU1IGN1_9BURK|nr:BCCT family transporter [Paracidovorax wautersii]MDR6216375.1 choline/glycine/proline betaine transport protein [Paracidovorax wautersii]